MGFINAMKNALTGNDTKHDDWNVLSEEDEVQEILNASSEYPQLVFKHSHRCSICIIAKEKLEENFSALDEKADMNFVNVVHSRAVSDALTDQTGVRHESPQVLIINDQKVVWHDSHHSIKADAVLEALKAQN